MDLRDALHLTWASIRTHKLRSILAAVGVVLGIGSVIGVVTMGAGFQETILGSFTNEFDADLLSLGLDQPGATQGPPTAPPVDAFTDRDVDALAALPLAKETGASAPIAGATAQLGDDVLEGVEVVALRGADFAKLDQGRAAEAPEEATVSNLTALRLMAELGRSDVIGARLALRYPEGDAFRTGEIVIVGVQKPTTFAAAETVTVDGSFAPTISVDGVPTRVWRSVVLRAEAPEDVGTLRDVAKAYLEGESDAAERKGDRLAFRYDTVESVTALISTAILQFTAFVGALGIVALLVGLVGIANIMLVSVSERTREIGVMKATGATRGNVLLVFLLESVAICVVGAALGIGLGMLMGLGLNTAIASLSGGETTVPFVLVYEWYAIAVFLGAFVGIVAGLYPAWRAARVSPVEALRYE